MNELRALSEEKVNYGQERGVTCSEMGGRFFTRMFWGKSLLVR